MNGRLEAQILFETAQTITVSGTAAGAAVIAVGPWYPSDLLTEIDTQLTAATGVAWTVTGAFGEAGTGLVTIDKTAGGNFVLTWTTTDIRDVLGFTGAATASAGIQIGTIGMKGVWLPDCSYSGESFDNLVVGHRVNTGYRQVVSPEGDMLSLSGSHYRQHERVRWSHVGRDRFIDGANAALISWQQFVHETQQGDLGYFQVGSPVRFYSDATNNTLLAAYKLNLPGNLRARKSAGELTAYWPVDIPRMIEYS